MTKIHTIKSQKKYLWKTK